MSMSRRTFTLSGTASGLTLATALCMPAIARAAAEPLVIADATGNSIYWDLDVATEKGFFQEAGLTPSFIVGQSSPEVLQLLLTGATNLAAAQPEPTVSAINRGANTIGAIAAPMNHADWTLNGRKGIDSLADLKGQVIGVSALKNSECLQTTRILAKAGLGPNDFSFLVVGTSPLKLIALERGAIAAAVLFQPSGQLASDQGLQVLARFSDLRSYPSILYVVGRDWAAKNGAGKRLTHALTRAHQWLWDPSNRQEAIQIVQKYTKRTTAVLDPVYQAYFGPHGIYSKTGEIELGGLTEALNDMAGYEGLIQGKPKPAITYVIDHAAGGLFA